MSEGEKKRFGNFAEYAKARQATKDQLPIGGLEGEVNTFGMQQQGMGIMGGQPGGMQGQGMPQQGMSQGLGQRGMQSPGLQGMGGMGGMQQMNRGPMGMQGGQQGGVGALGLGRSLPPQNFGFEGQQQQQQQGLGNQRVPQQMQGMGTIGQIGQLGQGQGPSQMQGSGQPGYSPSGEILAMLNKGGMGQGPGQAHMQGPSGLRGQGSGMQHLPVGGFDGPQQGGALDPSDFPALGGGQGGASGSQQSRLAGLESGNSAANLMGSGGAQKEFSMEEEFPALPGAGPQVAGPSNNPLSGGGTGTTMVDHFQRMKLDNQASGEAVPPVGDKPDRFGMLGLLSVIRMMDENLNTLALGTDLTLLGLNLNSQENLYENFASPWAEPKPSRPPEYVLPRCYYISPPALKTVFFQKFSDMTLFYIFYHFLNRPSDAQHQELRASLVKYAYQELTTRGWQYQQDSNFWVTRVQSTNEFKYFDYQAMELRPFLGQPQQGQPSQPPAQPQAAEAH